MGLLRKIKPSLLFALLGVLFFVIGLSVFTFTQAEGLSYFSSDSSSCANCHVMQDQFDAWGHSSHARVAGCNDCHSPHDNIVNQYFSKAVNGFNHSAAFTFNTYNEVITIKEFNIEIVNNNCAYCHANLVHNIVDDQDDSLRCTACHAGIGHPIRN